MKKKRLALALATVMALSLIACSGGGGDGQSGASNTPQGSGGTAQATINKDAIYRETELSVDFGDYNVEDINRFYYADGRVIGYGMHYEEVGDAAPTEGDEPAEEGDAPETETPQDDMEPDEDVYEAVEMRSEVFKVSFLPDGSDLTVLKLADTPQHGWYGYIAPGEDGTTYAIRTTYPEDFYDGEADFEDMIQSTMPTDEMEDLSNEDADGADATDETGGEDAEAPDAADKIPADDDLPGKPAEDTETYEIVKFDADGEIVYEAPLTHQSDNAEYYGVNNMLYVEGNGLLINDSTGVALYNGEDGTFERVAYQSDNWPDVSATADGRVFVRDYNDSGEQINELDLEKGEVKEEFTITGGLYAYNFYNMRPAIGADFLLTSESGVYAWDVGETVPKMILNYVDSDLDMESVDNVLQISETEMILYYYRSDDEQSGYVCSLLTKVPPEEIKDRTVLTLGVNWLDTDVRRAVIAFNKESEDSRISLIEYSQYITEDNWRGGYQQMNTDIVSGNGPDIMILNNAQQIETYEAKGILEPLDEYMAQDAEISAKQYQENIFDAYRYKDKLYMVIPSFMAYTYAMKAKDAAEIETWDFKTLQKMADERNIDYMKLFGYPMPNQEILTSALLFDSASYIDWSAQRAKFDTPQFIDLLNFAKQFPNEEDIPDNWWEDSNTDQYYRTGEALIAQAYMGEFNTYTQMRYVNFDDEIVFVGFPREDGSGGSGIYAGMQIAMNSASKDKDACWKFMRTFLLDDYQDRFVDNWYFPVGRSQLEAKGEKSMERPHYTDPETGETEYWDDIYYINGEQITVPPLTQEDVDVVLSLIDSLSSAYSTNETLINLVQEEAAPFFKNQKSAEEVAKIIQSKIQLYIDENS